MSKFELDWDDLLNDDTLSLEQERNMSVALSEYLVSQEDNSDLVNTNLDGMNAFFCDIKEKTFARKTKKYSMFSREELTTRLDNQEFVEVNPLIPYPKVRSLEKIFNLATYLSIYAKSNVYFQFEQVFYFGQKGKEFVLSLVYLGYLHQVEKDYGVVYLPTNNLKRLRFQSERDQLLSFVEQITSRKTIKECLMLQFYTGTFDLITKQIIADNLSKDLSVMHENLTSSEIDNLVNNSRSWYLYIKNTLQK